MRQYIDTLQDLSGNALPLGTCTVRTYPGGALAPIFSDNGLTPIATSIVSADVTGQISFFAADGDYTLQLSNNGTIYKTQSPVSIFDGAAQITLADVGAVNAYATTSSNLEKALRPGLRAYFNAAHTNTGASTFQYNTLTVKPIVQPGGFALNAGAINVGGIYALEYDGANWQLLTEPGTTPFYPATLAEGTAGVAIVNFSFPPFYVDRYVNNTVPGTTDTSPGFNAAINVARVNGGTILWGRTAPYATTNPINATSGLATRQFGMVFRCECGPVEGNLTPGPALIGNHAGHVFDFTGTSGFVVENVAVISGATTPQTAFFQARIQSAAGPGHVAPSCGISRFHNCSTLGVYTKAAYYNYAAEDDQVSDCYFNNNYTGAGGKVMIYTGNNILGLTSTFQTVASGLTQSSIDHKIIGGEIYMQSHDAAADCISLEQSDSVKIIGPWMLAGDATAGGRSLVHMDLSNAASNFCVLDSITAESTPGFQQNYCVHIDNAPSGANQYIPVGWTIKGCKLVCTTSSIFTAGVTTTLDGWVYLGNTTPTSNLAIAGVLRNSYIEFGLGTNVSILTSTRNCLVGDTSSLTITNRQSDIWYDMGATNKSIAAITTTGVTSSAGALVARARISLNGPCLTFNIVMASASGNLTIAAGATLTLTLPGGQPMSLVDSGAAFLVDFTSGALVGAQVSSSAGNAVITVPVGVAATPHTIICSGTVFLT